MIKKRFLAIIVFAVVLLSLAQLLISHNLATAGDKLLSLEARAEELEKDNEALNSEISKIGSLTAVSQRAKKLGFVRDSHVVALTPEVPVALNR